MSFQFIPPIAAMRMDGDIGSRWYWAGLISWFVMCLSLIVLVGEYMHECMTWLSVCGGLSGQKGQGRGSSGDPTRMWCLMRMKEPI